MTKFLPVLAMSLILSGCVELMTRNDVREAEQRRQVQDQVTTLQKTNADTTSKFQEYDSQLRELTGRVEKVEVQQEKTYGQRDKESRGMQDALAEQTKTSNMLRDEMVKMQGQIETMAKQIQVLTEAKAAAAASEKETKEDEKKTPYDQGEELFGKKDWKKAILSYQKYRETFPKGKKFPDATYKIGVCFQELGMKTEAASFYEEVISKFPSTETAKKAKVRIKKVK